MVSNFLMSFVDMGLHVSQVPGWNGQRMYKVMRNCERIVSMSFHFIFPKVGLEFIFLYILVLIWFYQTLKL